jgi:hypothetical protein
MLEYGTTARTFLAWRTAVQHLSAGRAAVHRLISWSLGEAFNLWRAHTSFLRAFSALKVRVNGNRNAFISRLTLQVGPFYCIRHSDASHSYRLCP